ncbi:MAG: hypothetical protein ACXABV_16585 [Candidatus Thorarchaeota archaeon]|jgi:hypothetical protein
MSLQDKFEEEMREVCTEYHNLLQQKEALEAQLETLHDYIEATMKKYNQEGYDDPEVPVKVDKIEYVSERMKRGGKKKLKEILTGTQWSEIYKEKKVVSYRITQRED